MAEHGLTPHLRFGHEVQEAAWDAAHKRWRLTTCRGALSADVLVLGSGALSDPAMPALEGIERFAGKRFHSASWDHGYSLAGKRVAVIGTGASAIQFVPAIQPEVEQLFVFQRTPPWIMARHDRALGEMERRAMRATPLRLARRGALYAVREASALAFFSLRGARLMQTLAERHLKAQIADPALREKLTPTYATGCKRILMSDDYLPALTRANVELVTDPIARIHPTAIETKDGRRRQVDAIIFGTGFKVQAMPILSRVRGADGRSLADTWREKMSAHLGTTVAGFPNLFFLQGPNTGLGHTSVLLMIEAQIEHLLGALRYLDQHQLAAIEPTGEAQTKFVRGVDEKMQKTVWVSGGCKSWYLDDHGHSSVMWPGFTFTYRRRVEPFDPSEYTATERAR